MAVVVTDPSILEAHSDLLEGETVGFDPVSLLSNGNICLLDNDTDNLALFERGDHGIYTGHYFFRVGGKEGMRTAKEFLSYMFSNGAKVVQGLTPVDNKKALVFSRKIGFTKVGTIETPLGDMVLQMITSKEINS